MAAAATAAICNEHGALLTSSSGERVDVPHHADQTELYSRKQWVRERFCEAAIQASPVLEIIDLK